MNRRQPPSLATWLLEHLTSHERDDALAGDLLEVHSGGRSDGWYWRQVASAIVIGCLRNLRSHSHAIVFAALWCMLAPAWLMVVSVATERAYNSWHVGQLQWPWSAIASLALSAAPGLIFVWAGLVFYLVPELHVLRGSGIPRPVARFTLTALIYTVISIGVASSAMFLPESGRLTGWSGPAFFFASDAPYFALKAVGGGRDVAVIRSGHGAPAVQITTRVYIESRPFWTPKPFQLDGNASPVRPTTALGAIEEGGMGPVLNRLTVFSCLLFALWRKSPKRIEGHS